MKTQEEINEIFKKWEQLLEKEKIPPEARPRPLSIEEYQKRQIKNKQIVENIPKKKKKRGGKKVKRRKEIAILYREYHLESNIGKKIAIKNKIKNIRRNI